MIWDFSCPSVFRHELLLDSSVIIEKRVFCVAAVLSHHDALPCQLRAPLEIDQHTQCVDRSLKVYVVGTGTRRGDSRQQQHRKLSCIITELSSKNSWRNTEGMKSPISPAIVAAVYPPMSPLHIVPHRHMELSNIKWIISVVFLSTINIPPAHYIGPYYCPPFPVNGEAR